tara:strand:- start:17 stop:322 length:306 start_codon:yes stop_codon:yes gene_type:complete
VYLPAHFKCQPNNCDSLIQKSTECLAHKRTALHPETGLHRYTCPSGATTSGIAGEGAARRRLMTTRVLEGVEEGGALPTLSNTTEYYNPAASLLYVTGKHK